MAFCRVDSHTLTRGSCFRKCLGFVVFVISYMIMLLIVFLLAVSLGPQKKAAPVGLPRLRCPATTLALCPSLGHLSKESRLEV